VKRFLDRILWNRRPDDRSFHGGDIDEIVIHDATVHIEQMGDRCWWIGIYKDERAEVYWAGNFTADSRGRMSFSQQDCVGIEWGHDETHETNLKES
jgi:hypothetical protein